MEIKNLDKLSKDKIEKIRKKIMTHEPFHSSYEIGLYDFVYRWPLSKVMSSEDRVYVTAILYEKDINFDNKLNTLYAEMFNGLNIGSTLTLDARKCNVEGGVLLGCKSVTEIKVDPQNKSYEAIDGNLYCKGRGCYSSVLYSDKKMQLTQYALNKKVKVFTVPENVGSIASYAFASCRYLETVTIPNGVYIGDHAFDGCKSLKKVIIGDDVIAGNGVFLKCTALEEVYIGSNVIFGDYAFLHCTSLKKVEMGFAASIATWQFADCKSLSEIVLPEGLKVIGHNAFKDCLALSKVILPAGLKVIGDNVFNNCQKLKRVKIPNSVVEIYYDAFDTNEVREWEGNSGHNK